MQKKCIIFVARAVSAPHINPMTMKKLLLTLLGAVVAAPAVMAQAPAGYYNSLEGKSDAQLKTAIYDIVRNFNSVSSYTALPDYFKVTDVYPGTSYWWDMYSDMHVDTSIRFGQYMNREHSFPKSWWGGKESVKAYTDLNHLYPGEAAANQKKSNWPLGEVDLNSNPWTNGVTSVGTPRTGIGGSAQKVFEPADEYKGDFARTYFYMVTCYQDYTWDTRYMWMLQQNTYPTLQGWAVDMLLRWSREDPVSEKETNRNNAVFRFQSNRNPFIDHPELIEYIWGNRKGQIYHVSNPDIPGGDPELITPVQGMSLDFSEVAVGSSATSQLLFRGNNLSGSLDIVLTGADRAMFGVSTRSIPASAVNSADGYMLDVTYTPTAIGTHEARLVVSEGGIEGSRGIALIGQALEVPVLTACTATDATDITATSYVANWTYPAGETIDYWVITRQKYSGSQVSTEEVLAEQPGFQIDGFDDSDREAYSVQSVRLGYRSPMSNVIFVSHAGITGVESEHPLVVLGFEGFMRLVCSAAHTGVRVYDVAGVQVAALDRAEPNTEIALPQGIYFVLTDRCGSPVKVIVR